MLHECYRADTIDDATAQAFDEALAAILDGEQGDYEMYVERQQGVRKLWSVMPADQTDEPQGLREPPLIGRVVAVDEQEALALAQARYLLQADELAVCQI